MGLRTTLCGVSDRRIIFHWPYNAVPAGRNNDGNNSSSGFSQKRPSSWVFCFLRSRSNGHLAASGETRLPQQMSWKRRRRAPSGRMLFRLLQVGRVRVEAGEIFRTGLSVYFYLTPSQEYIFELTPKAAVQTSATKTLLRSGLSPTPPFLADVSLPPSHRHQSPCFCFGDGSKRNSFINDQQLSTLRQHYNRCPTAR